MPRDDWAKARSRDAAKRSSRGKLHGWKPKAKHRKKILSIDRAASRWSPESKLWFGKFTNRPLRAVPLDYLRWLACTRASEDKSWRMTALRVFLRRYIAQIGNGEATP